MHRYLILYPVQGMSEAEFLAKGVKLTTRIECLVDGRLANYLTLDGESPMIRINSVPASCGVTAYHPLIGERRYFLAGDFHEHCRTIDRTKDWDRAVAAMINQLPPETVVYFEAYVS